MFNKLNVMLLGETGVLNSFLTKKLRGEGFTAESFTSASRISKNFIHERKPDVAVITVKSVLFNPMALAEKIRSAYPKSRILIISYVFSLDMFDEISGSDVDLCIPMPADTGFILEKISSLTHPFLCFGSENLAADALSRLGLPNDTKNFYVFCNILSCIQNTGFSIDIYEACLSVAKATNSTTESVEQAVFRYSSEIFRAKMNHVLIPGCSPEKQLSNSELISAASELFRSYCIYSEKSE